MVGYDLLRRFALEIDRDAGLAWLIRPGGVEIRFEQAFMRLAVLDRRPYLEAEWVDGDEREWVRLQVELSWPGAACLDSGAPGGEIVRFCGAMDTGSSGLFYGSGFPSSPYTSGRTSKIF